VIKTDGGIYPVNPITVGPNHSWTVSLGLLLASGATEFRMAIKSTDFGEVAFCYGNLYDGWTLRGL
jgi:hypothetical protein